MIVFFLKNQVLSFPYVLLFQQTQNLKTLSLSRKSTAAAAFGLTSKKQSAMGHSNVWNSHPKTYGPGSRTWYVHVQITIPQI
ncbi:hypothetical protein RYX36_021192 [Vicia faba]